MSNSDDEQKAPQQMALPPQAIQWMEDHGINITMVTAPRIQTLHMPGTPAGTMDPSKVQCITRLRVGPDSKDVHSGYVKATREEMTKLFRTQFELSLKEALDRHFSSDEDEE